MFKKSSFGVVLNFWLALVIGIILTVFSQVMNPDLTPSAQSIIVGIFTGFFVCLGWETLIDLPGFGNFFVKKFGLKMDGKAAYCVRILFIVIALVILMSLSMMFIEMGYSLTGAGGSPVLFTGEGAAIFFSSWITAIPGMFIVAYIAGLIVFNPLLALTGMMCTKDPGPGAFGPGGPH